MLYRSPRMRACMPVPFKAKKAVAQGVAKTKSLQTRNFVLYLIKSSNQRNTVTTTQQNTKQF